MKAANEFEAAIEYIARQAPVAARRLALRIMRQIRSLRQHPDSGGFIPEDAEHRYREILAGNYRIVYRREKNAVVIMSIRHAARLLRLEELQ